MKHITLLTALILIMVHLSAQKFPDEELVDKIYKTKTMLVKENNPMNYLDAPMQEAMEEEWNITKWETISYSEFLEMRSDTNYSFVYISTVTFPEDAVEVKYRFLNLALGSEGFANGEEGDLISIPVAYAAVDQNEYTYKIRELVRVLQRVVDVVELNPDVTFFNVWIALSKNRRKVKHKTLYLREVEMSVNRNTEEKIREIYPHPFKLVSRAEIEKAIEERNSKILFLHEVGPMDTGLDGRCFQMLLSAGSPPRLYFYDFHHISEKDPDGLRTKDLKKLRK